MDGPAPGLIGNLVAPSLHSPHPQPHLRPRRSARVLVGVLLGLVLAVSACSLTGSPGGGAAPSAAAQSVVPAEVVEVTVPARPHRRPNLVLITTDDQTAMEMRWMPKTRRLLGEAGVTVDGFVAANPLCCPARAEILTGEYSHNNGVRFNRGRYGGWEAFLRAGHRGEHVGRWLQRAGYRTGFVGKMMNGYAASSTTRLLGWDTWTPMSGREYTYYGTEFLENGRPVRHPATHASDVVRDHSNRFVTARSRKPFFLWASHVGPHVGTIDGRWVDPVPARRHADRYRHVRLPVAAKRSYLRTGQGRPRPVRSRANGHPASGQVALFRERIRTLASIDEANASLIRTLRKAGELENTVVMFTSDNGYLLGEHNLTGKNLPYAESLAVPFLARGPGLPAGTRVRQTLSTVDLAPTLLRYAGALSQVRAAGRTDGIDMVPVLQGRTRAPDTQLIQGGTGKTRELQAYGWAWQGVLSGRYTYARWWTGEQELYDNVRDPEQRRNLAGRAAFRPVRAALASRLRTLSGCSGPEECERDFGPLPLPRR